MPEKHGDREAKTVVAGESRRAKGPSAKELSQFAETHAAVLRGRAKAGPAEPLDPRLLTEEFGLVFVDPTSVEGVTPADRLQVARMSARTWSGMASPLPDGRLLVMLNPSQTPERARVTIMEEVAHAYFGHRPSSLATAPEGFERRRYDPAAEAEAYWTAAAALLPAQAVGKAVWRGRSAEDVAREFGVSPELVEFRIKTLRLWPDHREHSRDHDSRKAA